MLLGLEEVLRLSGEALFLIYLQSESLFTKQLYYIHIYAFQRQLDVMWYWTLHTVYGIAINYKIQSFGSVLIQQVSSLPVIRNCLHSQQFHWCDGK